MSASCTPCVGRKCLQSCKAAKIDSIQAAQKLKGCQNIEGALDIRIRSSTPGNAVMKGLEDSLSDIVEIEGYLKIIHSKAITSLSFLKNLQVIRGNQLASDKYAIEVYDNENIQQLFPDDQEVKIEKGKLFFHFNPKLCFEKIEKLATGNIMIELYDTAKLTNGDRATCNFTSLDVDMKEVDTTSAIIQIQPIKLPSDRLILGFVAYYTEAADASSLTNDLE